MMHYKDAENVEVLFFVDDPRSPEMVRQEDLSNSRGEVHEKWLESLSLLRKATQEYSDT